MKRYSGPEALDRHRFPIDPWRLVETAIDESDRGVTETLFAIGNGYIGMRGNPTEGRVAYAHGTYLNGFHETWPIQHAESAHAFAKTGQTIVNVPDAKLMKLYVDDEPLLLGEAELDDYERVVDFRAGYSWRDLIWRTPSGKRIQVRTTRMVSLVHRHLAVLTFEVRLLDATAPIVVSSQLINRQDGQDEYHVAAAALGEGTDPRQARMFERRVLDPRLSTVDDPDDCGGEVVLGYRCARSGMTVACAYQHEIESTSPWEVETEVEDDLAKTVFTIDGQRDATIRITKYVAYHSSRGVPAEELADRCHRTLHRARQAGVERLRDEQQAWLDDYWETSDVEVTGDDGDQQAIRYSLYQLAQNSACTNEQGIAAKGVTGGGYDGHYFWDTEVYVLPFLAFTNPNAARKLLRWRWHMLESARERACELSQKGALYPWRTINGEEASAYYAAGTAQYHINAAVAYAIERYWNATGDIDFMATEGVEILVETARLWADLGFYATNGAERFHIHGVTGPDEYTTVVNDNLYTNVMARFNLRFAVHMVQMLAKNLPDAYGALCRRTNLGDDELTEWERASDAMYLPYDETLGIHPQDAAFLERERWDFEHTPADKYPLLLHFHPLVIYRHQVLKQADVVLAMFLRGDHFSLEQKKRNFDYYDPLTTGDSSLSACVQSIVAAEVGEQRLAHAYFRQSLYLDLVDSHGNTADGLHVANAGGIWAALTYGFAGFRDSDEDVTFAPRLPATWSNLRIRMVRHDVRFEVNLDATGYTVAVLSGDGLPLQTPDGLKVVGAGEAVRVDSA